MAIANLDWNRVNRILAALLEAGLVVQDGKYILPTMKGFEALACWKQLTRDVKR